MIFIECCFTVEHVTPKLLIINMNGPGSTNANRDAMTPISRKLLFWSPRVICILFAVFLSLFALDVFDGRHGFWQTMLAFLIHLIPVFALVLIFAAAWRWEWIGAAFFPALGALYVWWAWRRWRWPYNIENCATIAGPLFLLGGLFLLNWLYRAQIRGKA
jgi:hypothetical protein